ncbi:MAG TPA: response regulator transcription factor [Verrucomicrobiae bacterium]|nr:response regulator transcription factor [Verrucomicrobiae bacterium]
MKSQTKPTEKAGKRRVLIVDDHAVLREGLALVINVQPDLLVCGEAATVAGGLQAVTATQPDIALVDLSLTGGSGLELVKDLKASHPNLLTLVLSLHDEALYAERVLRAGARGYIMKRSSTPELLAAIRKVLDGEIYLSERMGSLVVRQALGDPESATSGDPLEQLSDRELEVFQLLGEGHGTREIAQQLGLSMKTVSCYRQNIQAKLQLKDSAGLVQRAVHWAANLRAR